MFNVASTISFSLFTFRAISSCRRSSRENFRFSFFSDYVCFYATIAMPPPTTRLLLSGLFLTVFFDTEETLEEKRTRPE